MSCAPVSITPVPSRAEHRAGLGLEHQRRKGRGAHAPADQQPGLVAHLPRRQRPAAPSRSARRPGRSIRAAPSRRTACRRSARPRHNSSRRNCQRVHAAGLRHLVDRAFERDRAGRLAGRAHEQRRAGVEPHRLMRRRDGGAGIERVRGVGGRLEEIVEGARGGLGVMLDRRQRAVARRRPAAASGGSARDGRPGRYICSRRSTSLTGRPTSRAAMMPSTCGPEIRPLEPKPPPRKGLRMWMFSGGMPNSPAMRVLRHGQALARRVDRQRVAVPGGDDGVRLHRVVILRRRLVGRVDPVRRCREARLDVAVMRPRPDCRRRPRAERSFRRRRARRAPAPPHSAATAAPRLRSPPPASRRSPPRSAGWRSARGRSAAARAGT